MLRADTGKSSQSITKRINKNITDFKNGEWQPMLDKAFERGTLEQKKARARTLRRQEAATNVAQLSAVREPDAATQRAHQQAQESLNLNSMRTANAAAKRAASLIAMGRFSRAGSAINPSPRAPGDFITENMLQEHHPAPTEPHATTRRPRRRMAPKG